MQVGDKFNPWGLFNGMFIPNCIARDKNLTSTAKLCWGRLAQYGGRGGIAWPSQEVLAEEVGVGVRQIARLIEELEDYGLIARIKPTGADKLAHKTDRYVFLWHKLYEEDLRQNEPVADDDSHPVTHDESGSVAPDDSSVRESVLRESGKENSPKIGETDIKKTVTKEHIDLLRKKKKLSPNNLLFIFQGTMSEHKFPYSKNVGVKEMGMLRALSNYDNGNGFNAGEYIETAIDQWGYLKKSIRFQGREASRLKEFPSIYELWLMKDDILFALTQKPQRQRSTRIFTEYTRVEDLPADLNPEDRERLGRAIKESGSVKIMR